MTLMRLNESDHKEEKKNAHHSQDTIQYGAEVNGQQ